MDFWNINGLEVKNALREPSGRQFTGFVDAILQAICHCGGVVQSTIHTNQQTNIPDGGVDTQIDVAIPNDSTGWLSEKTIWQYKATDTIGSAAELQEDIVGKENSNKATKYAKKCIEDGYAYRYCICANLTPAAVSEKQAELAEIVRSINPDAPAPKIITADDLARIANTLPTIILHYFRPLTGHAFHIESWATMVTAYIPTYVPNPAWERTVTRIAAHFDLTVAANDVILPIQGDAGVGKTRLLYETVAKTRGLHGLAIYVLDDQRAVEIATMIANHPSLRAILIVDECSLLTGQWIRNILQGCRGRARVVTIDNSGERISSSASIELLKQLPPDVVQSILRENFPAIPEDQRREYARLAGGFLRLAADMCQHNAPITASNNVGSVGDAVRTYLHTRFPDPKERMVLEAISLVTKVGYSQDVSEELDTLCGWLGLPIRAETLAIARKLHDGPGFIGQSSRYFYVTPRGVAIAFFDDAWQRWAARDPEAFLRATPPDFLERFLTQVTSCAPQEVRSFVAACFCDFVNGLKSADLTSITVTDSLVQLVETDPNTYVPTLRRLINEATFEELLQVTGTSVNGRWGPRRQIVWLAERLAAFPEYFADAEGILRRLALAENEQGIGNNATAIWRQLFRIALSGTALPFSDRLPVLQSRLLTSDSATIELALAALNEVFSRHGTRMVTETILGGRIPPSEWLPTDEQYRQSLVEVLRLLCDIEERKDVGLASRGRRIAIGHVRSLLSMGLVNSLRVLASGPISDSERASILSEIDEFLELDCGEAGTYTSYAEYVAAVQSWKEDLTPTDLHGRLVAVAGTNQWLYRTPEREAKWKREVSALAGELLAHPDALRDQLPWLTSAEAAVAFELGRSLGFMDNTGTLLSSLVLAAAQSESASLARGYVVGLIQADAANAEKVNPLIDDLEDKQPALAFDLAIIGGDATNAFDRTLRLIDRKSLALRYLQAFRHGTQGEQPSSKQLDAMLTRLVAAAEHDDIEALDTAIELLTISFHRSAGKIPEVLANSNAIPLVWKLLRLTSAKSGNSRSIYGWGEVLKSTATIDVFQAIEITVNTLMDENVAFRHKAAEILMVLAKQEPHQVMRVLGEAILDDAKTWRFYTGPNRPIVESIPSGIVIDWVREHGREAARRIIRHAPPPRIGADQQPVVPELTASILNEFENDDQTFQEFLAGIHNMQMYEGDIAGLHEREADLARKFLNHPLKRIREWAQIEEKQSLEEAKRWRQYEEEMALP
ncbi:MAG: hypothetical protein ACLQVD_09105 [Capsulimonadaceae bacterium]